MRRRTISGTYVEACTARCKSRDMQEVCSARQCQSVEKIALSTEPPFANRRSGTRCGMNNGRYVSVSPVVEWDRKEIPITMDEKNRRRLGTMLRTHREALGLSSRQLEAITGITGATIVRIEQGEFAAPAPDKLARLADALGIPLADVYAVAEYSAPKQLPTFKPYLRTKYRDLPDEAADQIEAYAERLARKHGVDLAGPTPGEDEDDEPAPRPKRPAASATRSRTATKPKKKGGTK